MPRLSLAYHGCLIAQPKDTTWLRTSCNSSANAMAVIPKFSQLFRQTPDVPALPGRMPLLKVA